MVLNVLVHWVDSELMMTVRRVSQVDGTDPFKWNR